MEKGSFCNSKNKGVDMSQNNTVLSEQLLGRLESTAARDKMSVEKFIEVVCNARDKAIFDDCLKKVSGDKALAEILYEKLSGRAHGESKRDLAAEFDGIKGEFDMFKRFDMLPKSVTDTAQNENIPLKDAVLRYLFEQYKKSSRELNNQQKNGQSTLNPPKSSGGNNDILSAMLKGIRQ